MANVSDTIKEGEAKSAVFDVNSQEYPINKAYRFSAL